MDCYDGKIKQCFDREENMAASNLETLETKELKENGEETIL